MSTLLYAVTASFGHVGPVTQGSGSTTMLVPSWTSAPMPSCTSLARNLPTEPEPALRYSVPLGTKVKALSSASTPISAAAGDESGALVAFVPSTITCTVLIKIPVAIGCGPMYVRTPEDNLPLIRTSHAAVHSTRE